jgi:hypothetical protein
MAQVADLRRWYPTVPHSDMVRLKQYQVAALDDHAFLVRTDDLTHDPVSAAHYDTAGLVRLGERMANRVAGIT